MAGAGNREGVTEVTFRGRRSTLCVLDVWTRKVSWQVQGIVRLRVAVEVNVAVTLGLVRERVLFGGAGIAKLLGRAPSCVCSDGCFRLTFGGSLVRNARFEDLTLVLQTRSVTRSLACALRICAALVESAFAWRHATAL